MKNWFEIKAQADTAKPVEAFIYDEIGVWGTTAKDFIAALQPHKDREIVVRINSPGGSVWDGLAIYNYLRELNVTTRIDGVAASMASIVALAGKRVQMVSNGFFMVHMPSGVAIGNAEEIESYAEMLRKAGGSLSGIYQRETGASTEKVEEWMSKDTWFSAEEAKAAGLIDEITDEVSFSANANLSKFSNVPASLVDSQTKGIVKDQTITPEKTFVESLKALLGIGQTELNAEIKDAANPELIQARADLATSKRNLATMEARVKDLETDLTTKDAKIIALETDLKAAKTEATTAKEQANKQASIQAAQITAAQGQPPLEVKPTETPAKTDNKPSAKGFKAVVAAFENQINQKH